MITPKIFSSDAFLNFNCTTVHSSKKSFTFKKKSFQRFSFDFKHLLKILKVKVKSLSHVGLFAHTHCFNVNDLSVSDTKHMKERRAH